MLNKYILELHWLYTDLINDETCILHQPYFSGPALKIAQRIEPNNNIVIDLSGQYSSLISSHYFVTLFWKEVRYYDERAYLGDARFFGGLINKLSKLTKNDYILIDTSKHEENKHMYNLVYEGRIYTQDKKDKVING